MTDNYLVEADELLENWAEHIRGITEPGPKNHNSSIATTHKEKSNDKIPLPAEIEEIEKVVCAMPDDIKRVVIKRYWKSPSRSNFTNSGNLGMSLPDYNNKIRDGKMIIFAAILVPKIIKAKAENVTDKNIDRKYIL